MFLHSGASLHGHEYSAKRPPSGQLHHTRKGSLLKTALRPLTAPSDGGQVDQSLPSRSLDIPRANRRSLSGEAYQSIPSSLGSRAVPNGSSRKDAGVRFREPGMQSVQTPLASEDEESIAGSELTDGTCETPLRQTRRRRLPRKSTRYALALPAPQLRTKQRHLIQIRPRLLLQLQEIGDRRAIPAFDLMPSHLVAGRFIIPKLSKRFPRIFHANAELGQNDILLVRSEDYDLSSPTHPTTGSHEQEQNIMAVISASPDGCSSPAEIAFEDGSCWSASPMANGSYEFARILEGGQKMVARWVRRSNASSRNSAASFELPLSPTRTTPQEPSPTDVRWTFSIMDPSSRRHPVLGSLTQETLEVYDNYTTLSTSSGRYPPSRDPLVSAAVSGPESLRATLAVRPEEKDLMIATASWIRLHEQGWPASASPKFAKTTGLHCRTVSASTCSTVRRQTFPLYDGDRSQATSPLNSSHPRDLVPHSPLSMSHRSGIPARAMSTGRAFMKRRSGRGEGPSPVQREAVSPILIKEDKVDVLEADKSGCIGRVRLWTHRLFPKKKGPL